MSSLLKEVRDMMKRDLERQTQNGCNKTPRHTSSGDSNDDMYFNSKDTTLVEMPNELLEDTLDVLEQLVAVVRSYMN